MDSSKDMTGEAPPTRALAVGDSDNAVIRALNERQQRRDLHPYTCPGEMADGSRCPVRTLRAAIGGWVCDGCGYAQQYNGEQFADVPAPTPAWAEQPPPVHVPELNRRPLTGDELAMRYKGPGCAKCQPASEQCSRCADPRWIGDDGRCRECNHPAPVAAVPGEQREPRMGDAELQRAIARQGYSCSDSDVERMALDLRDARTQIAQQARQIAALSATNRELQALVDYQCQKDARKTAGQRAAMLKRLASKNREKLRKDNTVIDTYYVYESDYPDEAGDYFEAVDEDAAKLAYVAATTGEAEPDLEQLEAVLVGKCDQCGEWEYPPTETCDHGAAAREALAAAGGAL